MNKKIRLFLSLVILAASIALLVWGYWPNARETKILSISSTEMQLPTVP